MGALPRNPAMSSSHSHVFTSLLDELRGGRRDAADQIMALVYKELRKLAEYYMRQERSGHTLQATALVNEVYVDLFSSGKETMVFEDREHFFATAARQMRRVLVDHARKRNAQIRGGGATRIPLEEAGDLGFLRDRELEGLDDALTALEAENPRASRVVELCFFGGMTQKEAGEALGISLATVQRDWEAARDFLFQQLSAA
jgi:RNA polymerase sigma factor (TIGR02999 family)